MSDSVVTDVTGCARCAKNHKSLSFRKFSRNPITVPVDTIEEWERWEYWAMCPTLNEPIILKVEGGAETE